jgi:hypothetical protein
MRPYQRNLAYSLGDYRVHNGGLHPFAVHLSDRLRSFSQSVREGFLAIIAR